MSYDIMSSIVRSYLIPPAGSMFKTKLEKIKRRVQSNIHSNTSMESHRPVSGISNDYELIFNLFEQNDSVPDKLINKNHQGQLNNYKINEYTTVENILS